MTKEQRLCWAMSRELAVKMAFAAGVMACCVSGTLYAVSLWLPLLKLSLGFTQTQTNLVAGAGSLGQYLGFASGLLNDLTTSRFAMLAGAAALGVGYGLLALAAAGHLGSCPWWLVAGFLFLAGLGSFATFTAGFSPSVHNISRKRRSLVMGCMVAAFAASSLLFSLVFRFFFLNSIAGFLTVLASVCCGVGLLASVFVVRLPHQDEIQIELTSAAATADDKSTDLEDGAFEAASKTVPATPGAARPDVGPLQCLRNADFLMLVLFLALVNGPGLLWITIQGSVARSLGMANSADLVAILAVCSVAGRFLVGFANDYFASRLARSWFLLPCALLMSGTLLLFAFVQRPAVVYATAAFVGAAYGMTYVLTASLSTLWFGEKWAGTNNGLMAVGTAISVVLLGLLNGHIYGGHADSNNLCFGAACFQTTMTVASVMSLLAVPVCVVISIRNPLSRG